MGVSLLLLGMMGLRSAQADLTWIEGESPKVPSEVASVGATSRPQLLSGGKWLTLGIDAGQVDARVPGEFATLSYEAKVKGAGKREMWIRLGFEFARSPFEWRIGNGEWNREEPTTPTYEVTELDTWTEVAWLKLGNVEVADGANTIEFRILKTKNAKGERGRLLFGIDALVLSKGSFEPNGPSMSVAESREPKAFVVPQADRIGRVSVPLNGTWQIARDDEVLPAPVATPMNPIRRKFAWSEIAVPGDKAALRADLVFAHRVWYRTIIEVPAGQIGQSFHIYFPQNSLNTTVLVNGIPCGFDKNPFAAFQLDVTKGIRAGRNQVWVGIRDAWYGYTESPTNPMKLRRNFNIPRGMAEHGGFQDLAYPVWGHFESGILATPQFVVAGPTKTEDAFVKTSVSKKRIDVEFTLSNPRTVAAKGEVRAEVLDSAGKVVKSLPVQAFDIEPDGKAKVASGDDWPNPTLWWPDAPNLYTLRTTLVGEDKAVLDVHQQPFGFREWGADGPHFTLNGLRWHGWADTLEGGGPDAWLKAYRASNQRMMRFWGTDWKGMEPNRALSWFDEKGVVVRRSGMLDGQAIGYFAIENDPELKELYKSPIKMQLMQNWKDQMLAQVRAERNHPSIMLWSLENEWLYINCINLHGDLMDDFERAVTDVSKAVLELDPTRLTMTDGGGANKDQSMPVHGNHYVFSPTDTRYPGLAYQAYPEGGGRGRWNWDQKRPRFLGEEYFANGINPFDFALYGGEAAFQGKAETREGAGRIYRMLTEGYRWAEYGAWHFWMGEGSAVNQYTSNAPLAAFVKEYDWTHLSGTKLSRTVGIFNDTRFADPVTFSWTLELAGKVVAKQTLPPKAIAPGHNEKFSISIPLPVVTARQSAKLRLQLVTKGKVAFSDVKTLSILPVVKSAPVTGLALWDPSGKIGPFLKASGYMATPVAGLEKVPATTQVLVVGPNALGDQEGARSRLAALADRGVRVIVLEQKSPVRYQGLPAEMESQTNEGRIAYVEDASHPALKGLKSEDFFTWGADQVVYRNAYGKPTRGAKSLIQCEARFANSALAEVPVGRGLLLLSQLRVGEVLAKNAVAQRLLANLIDYAAGYKLEFRPVVAVTAEDKALSKALDASGVKFTREADLLKSLTGAQTVVVTATPAHLKALASNKAVLDRFLAGGGWIVLSGLTPEGLADYNKVVGQSHMIRPFRRERVTFPAQRHPLTAGLTTGEIVMQSGKPINGFTKDVYIASDVFSYAVDVDDAAPFAKLPTPAYFGYEDPAQNDHDPMNMVNGFVSSDGWQYIFSINHEKMPTKFDLTWPKAQPFREMEWTGNAFYDLVTKVELTFDGKDKRIFNVAPGNSAQRLSIQPAVAAKTVTVRLAEWQKVSPTVPVIGIDNLRFFVEKPAGYRAAVQPLLNVGTLVAYPRGAGGIVLSNILFQDREAVPENGVKKVRILSTILRNLKAPVAGATGVIAGANLAYQPIDLSKQANQYRDERGWFGDAKTTFKDLPKGKQVFAGVTYQIFDFPTSPVPTAIMLGGPGVPNGLAESAQAVPVNAQADALFFLQAFRVDQAINDWERRDKRRIEVAKYVIEYADGQKVEVPLVLGEDVADYRQAQPFALPGAQIAWAKPFAGSELQAVAYAKQWNNPRPTVAIKSVTLAYGPDRRAVPALLAVTVARKGR